MDMDELTQTDWYAAYPNGFWMDAETGEIYEGMDLWTDGKATWRLVEDGRRLMVKVQPWDLL